jgi:tetratricopeptide (TPR) repeat protein
MPDESIPEQDCYRILDLKQGATKEEVAKAYRKMVMQYHPDRVQHLGEKLRKVAEAEFHKVQKAHKAILSGFEASNGGASAPSLRNAPSKPIKEYSLHDLLELSKPNPNNDRVFYNLGQKYFEQGMIDRAVESYGRALKLNPKNELAAYGLKIARLSTTLGGDGIR